MSEKFVGRSTVLQLGGSVLVTKRVKINGREETVELVAIEVDTLEVIGIYKDKSDLQTMLEDREWSEKVAAREAKKATPAASTIAKVLDDHDEDGEEDEEPKQFGQQPPV